MSTFSFEPIGILNTCFREKFGIPRQPGLVKSATGVLKLKPDPFYVKALKEMDSFSHIWIIFVFHENGSKGWKPSIRPPRLGGAQKIGVLASRSPHRPNPIGISVVKLEKIDFESKEGIEIHLSGVDILNGTPVLDIKPYLPYADSYPEASAGWANQPIQRYPVEFTMDAIKIIDSLKEDYPQLKQIIIDILELDPRPAFQKKQIFINSEKAKHAKFGFCVLKWDVKWIIKNEQFIVYDLVEM